MRDLLQMSYCPECACCLYWCEHIEKREQLNQLIFGDR
jgi:hypothetical protein